MSETNGDLKKILCSVCNNGGLSKSAHYDSEEEENIPIAKCLSCGAEFDQTTQQYYEIFADDLTADKDNCIFRLGLKGSLRGIEYEIIGRIRYQDEDEYEQSTWDEWFAVNAEGGYRYFVEEEGEVFSYEEYVPESIDMESDPSAVMFEGKKVSRSGEFTGRIVFAEGELPWKPEIGEPVRVIDFKKDGKYFTLEFSDEEVSITKGELIPYKEIIEAFRADDFKEKYENTTRKRKSLKLETAVYGACAAICFIAAIYSCAGDIKVQGVMNSGAILTQNVQSAEKSDAGGAENPFVSQVLYGPFKIDAADKLYEVTVGVNEAVQPLDQEWQSFKFLLINETRLKKEISGNITPDGLKALLNEIDALPEPVESYMVTGDFWDERGSDSEGTWHEKELTSSASFILDEAGQYYGFFELYSGKPRSPSAISLDISMVKSYRYFLIAMAIFAALGIVSYTRAAGYNELPFDMTG